MSQQRDTMQYWRPKALITAVLGALAERVWRSYSKVCNMKYHLPQGLPFAERAQDSL